MDEGDDLVHYLFVFVQLSSWEEHFVALTIDTDLPDSLETQRLHDFCDGMAFIIQCQRFFSLFF